MEGWPGQLRRRPTINVILDNVGEGDNQFYPSWRQQGIVMTTLLGIWVWTTIQWGNTWGLLEKNKVVSYSMKIALRDEKWQGLVSSWPQQLSLSGFLLYMIASMNLTTTIFRSFLLPIWLAYDNTETCYGNHCIALHVPSFATVDRSAQVTTVWLKVALGLTLLPPQYDHPRNPGNIQLLRISLLHQVA